MKRKHRRTAPSFQHHQEGVVLYIALIMLILLALIGIVGMQVSTLQERMSANYLASARAFQLAERYARASERTIIGSPALILQENCATPFDPVAWANAESSGSNPHTERIRNVGQCVGQCSVATGGDVSESLCDWYRITSYSRDTDSKLTSASESIVDTIFIRP